MQENGKGRQVSGVETQLDFLRGFFIHGPASLMGLFIGILIIERELQYVFHVGMTSVIFLTGYITYKSLEKSKRKTND